ncbi:GNAT family N-acetyltransferase [Microlunatus capsulatus]|uniref:GNAT superfamily N-acetyltransferase n=1 Tax=Microlunatus capsulatus TaxID=99117 RepID=A0ABS4Z4L7_9ACTN|nr:GNAT family N-acetyltransferase [Microlunatus capsulatus]MBP2415975.1 GNAT superfamily N-acetyltransferase [Microlunatus capsulatus]
MPFVRVQPDDPEAVGAAVEILEASRRVDDPTAPAKLLETYRRWLRYGWDLHPDEQHLYLPEDGADPVGVLAVDLPFRDNRHLVWADVTVHPDRRRRGHGSAMLAEVLRRTHEAGRTTVWMGCPGDDPGAAAFLGRAGFRYASHDARRRQQLADVDRAEVARLRAAAEAAASDYALVRLTPPLPEAMLAEIATVAESINDAPMGDLTWEREVFDADLVRDIEAAREGRGDRLYRVVARHRGTGELGGHTMVVTDPLRPAWAFQGDTAVARDHRGHRLGLLLKAEMMTWLAEVEPQLEVVETWNQADNTHMIAVNEALGYRLDRVFHMHELQVEAAAEPAGAEELAAV